MLPSLRTEGCGRDSEIPGKYCKQEPGIMLSVMAPASEIERNLARCMAGFGNTTGSCVVGEETRHSQIRRKIKGTWYKLHKSKDIHAFHTPIWKKQPKVEKMLSVSPLMSRKYPLFQCKRYLGKEVR